MEQQLPAIEVEAPTVRMAFLVNNSPFAGREGQFGSSRVLRERIEAYLEGLRFSVAPATDGLQDAMRYSLLAGGKRSWTQDVPLGRFEIKGPVTLTLNDGKKAQTLKQGDDMAVRGAEAAQTAAARSTVEETWR